MCPTVLNLARRPPPAASTASVASERTDSTCRLAGCRGEAEWTEGRGRNGRRAAGSRPCVCRGRRGRMRLALVCVSCGCVACLLLGVVVVCCFVLPGVVVATVQRGIVFGSSGRRHRQQPHASQQQHTAQRSAPAHSEHTHEANRTVGTPPASHTPRSTSASGRRILPTGRTRSVSLPAQATTPPHPPRHAVRVRQHDQQSADPTSDASHRRHGGSCDDADAAAVWPSAAAVVRCCRRVVAAPVCRVGGGAFRWSRHDGVRAGNHGAPPAARIPDAGQRSSAAQRTQRSAGHCVRIL